MNTKTGLALLISLMIFPQIVETIYSPALTYIAQDFNVSSEKASQTLSLYFFAFAFGVVFWGRMCDLWGRRFTMLSGLTLYGIASLTALYSKTFEMLLFVRMLAAFGASVGSIGTQTIARDIFQGKALTKIFSMIGIAMALSPGIGVLTGSVLTYYWGYHGVFSSLIFLALALIMWSMVCLPETKPENVTVVPLVKTFLTMISDKNIWCTAFLIGLYNINLFAYYQLAPFHFESLALSPEMFGYSGVLLSLGVGIGAWINQFMTSKGYCSSALVVCSTIISIIGGVWIMILLSANHQLFFLPIVLVVIAYGVAIPNILATALTQYMYCLGTAGALLGLLYYLLLGGGLILSGLFQHLGVVIGVSSILALPLALYKLRNNYNNF